jgi:hypothetical protein
MAVTWPVIAYDAMTLGKQTYKTTGCEVLDHRSVAVKQDNTGPRGITPCSIVKPCSLAIYEFASRRVSLLSYESEDDVPHYQENNNKED